jgi:hypothetical protein
MWKRSRICRAQGTLLWDHIQVGLPHIGANKQNPGSHLLAHDGKETLEGFEGAFLADSQQSSESLVDLVDQRQICRPWRIGFPAMPMA